MLNRSVAIVALFGCPVAAIAAEELLTTENYAKVEKGMTKEEVKEILGAWKSSATSGKDTTLTWRRKDDSSQRIEVHFKEGKVLSKSTTIKAEPVAKPAPVEKTARDDPFEKALSHLSSTKKDERERALEYFAKAPVDAARAPEVSRLIERSLGDKDLRTAEAAEKAIRRWATRENSPHFLKVLQRPLSKEVGDKNRDGMKLAVEVLSDLKEPAAVEPMVRLLKDFFLRDEVALALRKMGPELTEKELRKHASDPNGAMTKAIEEILEEFKDGGGVRLARNLKDLKSPTPELRGVAASSLATMYVHPKRRKEVAQALEPLLAESNIIVSINASQAMVRWAGPENEPALIKALSHSESEVRRLAAAALKEHGTANSVAALQPLAEGKDKRMAAAAQDALLAIQSRQ